MEQTASGRFQIQLALIPTLSQREEVEFPSLWEGLGEG
jgi:hypothetical protein